MKLPFTLIASLLLVAVLTTATAGAAEVAVYFSPRGGCSQAITLAIDSAQASIIIASYQFSHEKITNALLRAKKRNVKIHVIFDRNLESHLRTEPPRLVAGAIPVRTDKHEKLFHNKYAVIDDSYTITGSFNWTTNADKRNAENLIIIRDVGVAAAFTANFWYHWSHSDPFTTRTLRRNLQTTTRASFSNPFPRPQTKEPLRWLALLAPSTPTPRVAVLQSRWSFLTGKADPTFGN